MESKTHNKIQGWFSVNRKALNGQNQPTANNKKSVKLNAALDNKQQMLDDGSLYYKTPVKKQKLCKEIMKGSRNDDIKKYKHSVITNDFGNMITILKDSGSVKNLKFNQTKEESSDTMNDYKKKRDADKNKVHTDERLIKKCKPNSICIEITANSSVMSEPAYLQREKKTIFGTYVDRALNNLSGTMRRDVKTKIYTIILEAQLKNQMLLTAAAIDINTNPELETNIYEYV